MNIIEVIDELYRSGVDCGIESYRGWGVTAWIVDERNRRIEGHFGIDELESIADWLKAEAATRAVSSPAAPQSAPRALLAELSEGERKPAKQVTARERQERRDAGRIDGTNH